jgi:hypothetical protein
VKTFKSDALSVSSNLLTGLYVHCLQSQSFSEEKYLLTNSQVAELWKIREHKFKHYSILTEMRATAQLLGYFRKKGLVENLVVLSFSKFYPEVAHSQELQIKTGKLC